MLWMIDNYDSFVHNLATYFAELGCEIHTVRNDRLNLEQLSDAVEGNANTAHVDGIKKLEGLVISPGPGSPKDCGLCKQALQIAAGKVPVLGVCLGHQIIADTYGANVVHGSKPMHGKISCVQHNNGALFRKIPEKFNVTRYHSLVVSDKNFPPCLQVDARSNDNAIMAISHCELPIYGLQFHPEAVLSEYGHEILQNFVEICKNWHWQSERQQVASYKQAV